MLCLALPVLGACGPRSVRSPDWLLAESAQYPPSRYLTGVGAAPTAGGVAEARQAAATSARVELVQTIEVHVEHTQRLDRQSMRTETGGTERARLAVEAESSALSSFTRTSTDQIVRGIELKEQYHDEARGVIYVLAVLDKPQAAVRLVEEIQDLDRQVAALVSDGRIREQENDLLAAIRRYREALNLALKANVLMDQLRLVDMQRARTLVRQNSSRQVAALLSEVFSRYGLYVSLEDYPQLAATVRQALVENGLDVRSSRRSGEPGLTLWGTVNTQRGTFPSLSHDDEEPLHVCRLYLQIQLVDDVSGRIVGQVNLLENSNARTMSLAEERAMQLLRRRVRNELPVALYQALSVDD